jgi:hypothetical protein
MVDLFDNPVLCKECKKIMNSILVSKNGYNLRAIKCNKCGKTIFHPTDKQEYENYMRLKNKDFEVKMRMVGNSYAVSIPREIVNFMEEQEKLIDHMVRLSFEDIGKLSLNFNSSGENKRVVKSKSIKIIKNNKPILEAQQFYDSLHPERNRTKVFKAENETKLIGDKDERE